MSPKKTLRLATRKSPLALRQAQSIAQLLQKTWPELTIELLPMQSSGDRFLKDRLQNVGGKGLFVKELEEALLRSEADFAVHSMKDLPATLPAGLGIVAIPARDNPFDALLSIHYQNRADLPKGALVGTASLRRQAQLLAHRPDLKVMDLRGNIHTRLQRLDNQDFDAIILAVAGLERMNLGHQIKEIIPQELMLPSCGQGALGLECRLDDTETQNFLAPLQHAPSAAMVLLERELNQLLGGGCHLPVAIFCESQDKHHLRLSAKVLSADGKHVFESVQQGEFETRAELPKRCAQELFNLGAQSFIQRN